MLSSMRSLSIAQKNSKVGDLSLPRNPRFTRKAAMTPQSRGASNVAGNAEGMEHV